MTHACAWYVGGARSNKEIRYVGSPVCSIRAHAHGNSAAPTEMLAQSADICITHGHELALRRCRRCPARSPREGATASVAQVSTAVRRRNQGSGSGRPGHRSGMMPLKRGEPVAGRAGGAWGAAHGGGRPVGRRPGGLLRRCACRRQSS